MSQIRWDFAVGGLAAGLCFALYLKWQQPDPTPTPPPTPAGEAATGGPAPAAAEGADAPADAAVPRARTKLPRPVVTRTGGPELLEIGQEAGAEEPEPQEEDTAPPERFEPDDPAFREAIQEAAKELTPNLKSCLDEWWAIDPELSGRVEIEFILGEDGLSEVTLLDHDDVPLGPLSCFGAAAYEADWPGLNEGESGVVYPFVFSPD